MKQNSVIRSVMAASYGHFIMTLADGAVWRNVEPRRERRVTAGAATR